MSQVRRGHHLKVFFWSMEKEIMENGDCSEERSIVWDILKLYAVNLSAIALGFDSMVIECVCLLYRMIHVLGHLMERFRVTCTANGQLECVLRDHVFSLIVVYWLWPDKWFTPFLSTLVLSCFHPLISYFENFSTWIWRLSVGEDVTLKLSYL